MKTLCVISFINNKKCLCLPNLSVDILPDNNGDITYSGNFRVYSTSSPVSGVVSISGITDSVTVGGNDPSFLTRSFRYSTDGDAWSMWYDFDTFSPPDTSVISGITFVKTDDVYLAFKYLYDDGSRDQLDDVLLVNSITVLLESVVVNAPLRLGNIKPNVRCTEESCPEVMFNREAKLNLYDTGNFSDFYRNMSMSVNEMLGIPALYFQTSPNKSGVDFIFREYSLYDVVVRKCIKVVVSNNNQFPEVNFRYVGTDMDYSGPFEINLDKMYFESMFGKKMEPRKKDFLYLPMLNRMYEVQDVSIFRGFMMTPVYWKISLVKFQPNINYLLSDNDSKFLDNVLLTSDNQFGVESKMQEVDAVLQQQFNTASGKYDEVRLYMDSSSFVKETEFNYNYNRLINYYYDLSVVSGFGVIYKEKVKVSAKNDITITFNFMLSSMSSGTIVIISEDGSGTAFGLRVAYNQRTYALSMILSVNSNEYVLDLASVSINAWYGCVVVVSPTFKQAGMYVYSYTSDPVIDGNHTGISLIGKSLVQVTDSSSLVVNSSNHFALPKGNVSISNIRVFNKIIDVEFHEIVMSQLFLKDESVLKIIDNCRPRIGMPFVMKKY